jgi:hypothetical protein
MISIVGIGNAASSIVENFKTQKNNYKVYQLGSNQKNTKYTKKLKHFKNPEDYEDNIPDLSKFFGDINENIQVFVVGSSYSSNYTLGILQQLQSKKLEVFYIRPDVELLTGIPKLLENMMFGVLQEYARSGLFSSLTILSNLEIENSIPGLSIKNYYEKLNHTIFSCVHYLNFFNHTEPEIGQMARPSEINKIRSIAILDVKTLSEKWLFELDMPRETCYYICINQERLEKESGLHKQIVDLLKEKPRNAFRKVSYGIWETHLHDFGFCVTHTNAIQQNTLDKLEQE